MTPHEVLLRLICANTLIYALSSLEDGGGNVENLKLHVQRTQLFNLKTINGNSFLALGIFIEHQKNKSLEHIWHGPFQSHEIYVLAYELSFPRHVDKSYFPDT